MVVVKADAYGHGAIIVSRTLAAEGCRYFGVATIDEARELRNAGLRARIFLQAGFFASQAREIVDLDLTPFVFHPSLIAPLEKAAVKAGRTQFPVHVKVDTGATRLGVMPSDLGGKHAEQMQRIGMIGLECQRLAIECFGLCESAGLMMRKGRGKQAGDARIRRRRAAPPSGRLGGAT